MIEIDMFVIVGGLSNMKLYYECCMRRKEDE
jgi:hypothetical protein